ncbi:MAG TPA: energy transducer TonB, partial [Dyadobacter sp.]|nr:energy transducer TonB [Dyadobacter sp.]
LPGRVFVSFTVNVDGSLSDIKVLKGLSPQHDMEVIRIMKLMPKWKPGGRSENELSPIKYNLPIRFN